MQDAVDLLHPLLTDTVDYVKQGALIATALVLMQQPESKVPCLTASVSRRCRALAVHICCMFTLLYRALPTILCCHLSTQLVLLLNPALPSSAVQTCMCR